MKKRLFALLTAIVLALGLAGCTISSTPASVGKLGDIEITSGMYLLCQYQAYVKAQNAASSQPDTADSASSAASAASSAASSAAASATAAPDYAGMSAKKFLSQKISVTGDDGTVKEWLVSDYVASETLRNLQYYAAVKTQFAALGGALTDDEISTADTNAKSTWDANSTLYAKNGFNLATIQEYYYAMTMADDLLTLVYGPDGTTPVSDSELTDYAENDLLYMAYVSVPLYNTSTYAMDETQTADAKAACQAALDQYNTLRTSDTASSDHDNFLQALQDHLPDAYSAMGNTYSADALSLSEDFLTETTLSSYYSDDQTAQLKALAVGDATLIDSSFACELFLREDPLDGKTLDDIRSTVLSDMKGSELKDSLYAAGAALTSTLDEAAMKKLPASRVDTTSPSSTAA